MGVRKVSRNFAAMSFVSNGPYANILNGDDPDEGGYPLPQSASNIAETAMLHSDSLVRIPPSALPLTRLPFGHMPAQTYKPNADWAYAGTDKKATRHAAKMNDGFIWLAPNMATAGIAF
jgi:hypothetical protein